MFQLRATRATSTRSWQAICHPSQDFHRTYSILRRQSDLMSRTTSSSEFTDTTTATPSPEGTPNGTASKPVSLVSRFSQRNAARQTTESARRSTFEAESKDKPDEPRTESLAADRSLLRRQSALNAESDTEPHGRRTENFRANRSPYPRRRTPEVGSYMKFDGRGTEIIGATSFLPAQSAKSRDHAAAKWLKEGEEENVEGFVDGDQDGHEDDDAEYEEDAEEEDEEEPEDEEFPDEPPFDIIAEMDEMSEGQVAEWERTTWAETIQELRDQNAAEREAVAAATYTDLKELFGPSSAPPDSPRLQALKEFGGDYSSYLPPGYAVPGESIDYARLALGRNKQIPLKAQTEALRVLEASIGGHITKTG